MLLPKCVRVFDSDKRSINALVEDDWREVGTLVEYSGLVQGEEWDKVCAVPKGKREGVVDMALGIKWDGRLWRDGKIPKDVVREETARFIREAVNVYWVPNRAFGIFEFSTIKLIGVCPEVAGLGVGPRFIRGWLWKEGFGTALTRQAEVRAGTYADNTSARKMYRRLGMGHLALFDKRVLHK